MSAGDIPLLFYDGELRPSLEAHRRKMLAEIDGASEEYLLNTDIDEWVDYLVGEYSVESPTLMADEMEVEDQGEISVDVSHEYMRRAISNPHEPAYVRGRRVLLSIPYTGDGMLFKLQASTRTMNPPRAFVRQGEIQLPIEYPTDTARPNIKAIADKLVSSITQHLEWAARDCAGHNRGLADEARRAITQRRERVLADHSHLDDLGIKVKKRGDAPTTYQAPVVRRKPTPERPKAKAAKPTPAEPTMVGALYEHTLTVIRSWVKAMERTPGDYASAEEEALRDALLIMLNTHYEGDGQAEAFNKNGKTDILIRVEDRNIFIAECKRWAGEKAAIDALDQLLGYATWRDSKLALIFFVNRKDIAAVTEKAKAVLAAHPSFERWLDPGDDGELKCAIKWPDDPDRHAELAAFFVHLPA
ncbi:MAG TPA: hypothetical protein VFW48_06840 [Solirubrobacterales bacterium]|nr:hypothetical protein [Solirubrobacterales bacterium]